jgi:hypothetical protein
MGTDGVMEVVGEVQEMMWWWWWWCIDEPHSSLSVYFRITAPFADDHVIVSHAIYVT